jgi:CreA protein
MTIRRLARAARFAAAMALAGAVAAVSSLPAGAADEPELIFKRSTVFKWLTPNDKLATYGLDDPEVEGVAATSPYRRRAV